MALRESELEKRLRSVSVENDDAGRAKRAKYEPSDEKLFTWRIREIHITVSKEKLQKQLDLVIRALSEKGRPHEMKILGLAPSSTEYQYATVTCHGAVARALQHDGWVVDKDFFGITPLIDPGDAKVDLIAVSGLAGHAFGSFRSSRTHKVWLQDFIPTDVPDARVLVYGFDSTMQGSRSKHSIGDFAIALLESIKVFRQDTNSIQRPIIFIGHSLGGLLIKEALAISASNLTDPENSNIFKSSYGFMFFGVPNLGLGHEQLQGIVNGQPNEQLQLDLQVDRHFEPKPFLRELNRKFLEACEKQKPDFRIISYYEQRETNTVEKQPCGKWARTGTPCIMVTQESACRVGLGNNSQEFPLDTDHSGLVKFDTRSDHTYAMVRLKVQELVKCAPVVVDSRFSVTQALPHERQIWNDHQSPTSGPKVQKSDDSNSTMTPEQREIILKDLDFPQIDARLLNIRKAHDRTCEWLLQQPEYRDWLDISKRNEHHGFLWVKGKPGAGKSTMMKYALAHAKKTMTPQAAIISFFFNARGEALEKSTVGMYRSLLFQLLTAMPDLNLKDIPHHIQHDSHISDWTIEDLKCLLTSAICSLGHQHLVCFIDALDECGEDEVGDMIEFLESLGKVAQDSPHVQLNIFLSSRHYPYITIENGLQMDMDYHDGHYEDIEKYVNSKLKAGQSKQVKDIKANIISSAKGVFLWVVLVVQLLNTEYIKGKMFALEKCLKQIPGELDELFGNILTRDCENRESLVLCIQWILYSQRPLKRQEIYFAILSTIEPTAALTEWDTNETKIEDMGRFVLDCSRGLAEVTRTRDQTVQFIHESVKDYLLQGNGLAKLRSELSSNATGLSHERLKQCCQTYMAINLHRYIPISADMPPANSDEAKSLRMSVTEKFPFLEYAVHNVLIHSNLADSHGISQREFLDGFSREDSGLKDWVTLENILQKFQVRRYTLKVSLLYILVERNLFNLITLEMEKDPEIYSGRERHGNPAQLVLATANLKALKAILSIHVATFMNSDQSHNSLSTSGVQSLEEELQSIFTEVNDYKSKFKPGENFISNLAYKGFEAVIRYLLAAGKFNARTIDREGATPLIWAAGGGNKEIVQLLLSQNGVDLNFRDRNGWTPLYWAAMNGHEEVVELLLAQNGVDLDSKDNNGWTPLYVAALKGHKKVMELLIAQGGVYLDFRDRNGWTPLYWAAMNGYKEVVELLLTQGGVDLDSKDNNGWTPLSWAANNGHKEVVELLLTQGGVDIDSKDNNGWTPLSWAANNGHKEVVELLLTQDGVDLDSKNNHGWTPLYLAAINGYKEVMELLLAQGGVDLGLKDSNGENPLHLAARKHKEVMELLRAYGFFDINSKEYHN